MSQSHLLTRMVRRFGGKDLQRINRISSLARLAEWSVDYVSDEFFKVIHPAGTTLTSDRYVISFNMVAYEKKYLIVFWTENSGWTSPIDNRYQWRIYIEKFWTRPPPPGGPNSFNFMQFLGKFGKIVCWRLPPRVGAPSSGKSCIRHWL